MSAFRGFLGDKVRITPLPGQFFTEVLPQADDLDELKVILYTFWRLDHMEGAFRYLRRSDFVGDKSFMQGFGKNQRKAEAGLDAALEKALARQVLLQAEMEQGKKKEILFFLNSPKGRAAVEAISRGDWRPVDDQLASFELVPEAPNIYRLYEEHIGPLTPMLAEMLREAEETYPAQWAEEAMRIAVEKNARNWRYVSAILRKWKEEGRGEQKDRRDSEKARRRYAEWKDPDSG